MYIFPVRPAFSFRGKKFPPKGNTIPQGWKFFQGKKMPALWDDIFRYGKHKFPMDLHKILPSPFSSVGGAFGCRAKGPGFKSCVLLKVITNDFIIFDFSF